MRNTVRNNGRNTAKAVLPFDSRIPGQDQGTPMDNRSIFSKTGKGSLEIAKKSLKLSSEERQALILVDGKSCYEYLQEKLSRIQPVKLRAVFERLLELELIREFVGKSGGQNAASGYASASPPASATATAAPTATLLDDSEELDFTSLAPASSVSNDVAALRQAAAEDEKARQLRDAALRDELAQSFAAEAAGATVSEEAARASREEAMRKVQAHKAAQVEATRVAAVQAEATRAAAEKAAEQAAEQTRIKAEADRLAAEQRAREEKERQEREEAARLAAEEEARRKAETEARIKAEADRLVREQRAIQEKERQEREAAARVAAEQEAKRKAEEERIAREQREREEAARRAAEEETRRKAEEEARIKAEAERLAREQLEREERERREAEEAKKRAAEEAARQKAESARRAAEEEARIKAEAERLAREQMEREDAERREREEAPKRAAEEAARAEAETARRAAAEEARLKAEEDARIKAESEAQRKAEAERLAREQRELESRQRAEKDRQERDRLAREQEEKAHAEREAAAKQAALAKQTEAAASASAAAAAAATAAAAGQIATPAAGGDDLNFAPASAEQRRKDEVAQLLAGTSTSGPAGATPLTDGGPDTFADTGSEVDPFADDDRTHGNEQALASRREIEREAQERANARAEPASTPEPEHGAEPAHEDAAPAKVRRSGGGLPLRLPIGKIIGAVTALALVGAIGYLFMMPIDKPAIERALSERLGEAVTVDAAKFSPFPPVLTLSGMNIGPVKLNSVAAHTELSSLFSSQKNWKSVDISGLSIDAAAARNLIALGGREVPKIAAARVQIQRIKLIDTEIAGLPVAVPKFNADILLTPAGTLKQITLVTADEKARATLQPDDKGWLIDIESKGMAWPAGPKIAWENVRAKGVGSANGIKFDDYTITHFGGVGRGAGELGWNGGWKFNGNLDAGALESEAITQAFYEAAPVSGTIDGKLSISMTGATLARMFDAPQIDGALSVSKAILKNVDLARTAQTGAAAAGSTRFSEFSTTLALAGGKLQLKDIKGLSGLLTVSGNAQTDAAKNVSGALLVELGVGGSRAKASVKLSGTMAEPKLAK